MSNILALARPDIIALKAYSHASWDPALERLHANELQWRAETDRSLARARSLSGTASAGVGPAPHHGVKEQQLLPDAAAMSPSTCWYAVFAVRASTGHLVICPPTFGMYAVAARQGAAVREVPLVRDSGFALDTCRRLRTSDRLPLHP